MGYKQILQETCKIWLENIKFAGIPTYLDINVSAIPAKS